MVSLNLKKEKKKIITNIIPRELKERKLQNCSQQNGGCERDAYDFKKNFLRWRHKLLLSSVVYDFLAARLIKSVSFKAV